MLLNSKVFAVLVWTVFAFTFTCTRGEDRLMDDEWLPNVEDEREPNDGVKRNVHRSKDASSTRPTIQRPHDNELKVPVQNAQQEKAAASADTAKVKADTCRLTTSNAEGFWFKLFGIRNWIHGMKVVCVFFVIATILVFLALILFFIIIGIVEFWEALMRRSAEERFWLIMQIFGPVLVVVSAINLIARDLCD